MEQIMAMMQQHQGMAQAGGNLPQPDTAETVQISSFCLLKMLRHGEPESRAGQGACFAGAAERPPNWCQHLLGFRVVLRSPRGLWLAGNGGRSVCEAVACVSWGGEDEIGLRGELRPREANCFLPFCHELCELSQAAPAFRLR